MTYEAPAARCTNTATFAACVTFAMTDGYASSVRFPLGNCSIAGACPSRRLFEDFRFAFATVVPIVAEVRLRERNGFERGVQLLSAFREALAIGVREDPHAVEI